MNDQRTTEYKLGVFFAVTAYILWGLATIYWKFLDHVSAGEVLAHRIVWALVFLVLILFLSRQFNSFVAEFKELVRQPKKFIGISLAAVFISINWFCFIWAVINEQIVQTSLGFFIIPLVNVLLGVIVLKERLSFWHIIAICIALIGVVNMAVGLGEFPWVALLVSFSFGFYGLFKKVANLGALTGLTTETLLITPFALLYLFYLGFNNEHVSSFSFTAPMTMLLLIGAGIATLLPLLFFAYGAKHISLSLIGFFQYIAPTIQLIIGVLFFHEPFTTSHMYTFLFIWGGLIIFSLANTKLLLRLEPKLFKKKSFHG